MRLLKKYIEHVVAVHGADLSGTGCLLHLAIGPEAFRIIRDPSRRLRIIVTGPSMRTEATIDTREPNWLAVSIERLDPRETVSLGPSIGARSIDVVLDRWAVDLMLIGWGNPDACLRIDCGGAQ
jgi:hypothetical protein